MKKILEGIGGFILGLLYMGFSLFLSALPIAVAILIVLFILKSL